MSKSFITIVDAWRFERPLAIVLAASAMFLAMAAPPAHLSIFPGSQVLLAIVFGLGLGALGYAAMAYPWPRLAVEVPVPDEDLVPEDEQSQFAASEVSLRLRRADRHPDAPVRTPIFASRDLGSPFMEVGAFAPLPSEAPPEALIPDGDYAEVDIVVTEAAEPTELPPVAADGRPAHASAEPAPATATESEWPIPEASAPIAAFAPEDEPAPAPARAPRQSIPEMMERLSAGLERRAAHGDAALVPQDRAPALRDALAELNRLAARRG